MELWTQMCRMPFGKTAFSGIIGLIAPYTSSITATVQTLGYGRASASITQRPWLLNPFNSIHAIALANLGFDSFLF